MTSHRLRADGDVSPATLEKRAGLLGLRVALTVETGSPALIDHTGRPASPSTLSRHAIVVGPGLAGLRSWVHLLRTAGFFSCVHWSISTASSGI